DLDGGAERAGVGVESYAVNLAVLAIEEESLVGVEVEFADAEGNVFVVDGFIVAQDGDMRGVKHGMIEVPEIWINNAHHVFEVRGAMGGYDFGEELFGVPDGLACGCFD